MHVHCVEKKKEKTLAHKKAMKAYSKLEEEEERCKAQMASCETRDVRARQVRAQPLVMGSYTFTENTVKSVIENISHPQHRTLEFPTVQNIRVTHSIEN